ncbi:MAG: toll/interleukin-1 receptor domain-containing protein, partial [Acidimicrobiia bacterium]
MAKVFFSYSHKDEALRDQLETHLALLKNQGLIESWHDRRIVAGSEVDQSIYEAMESSEVILLLISADFLASAYCYSREMKRAMERHDAKEARVIPVILRDCDWHSAPFGKLLAAPRDGKPVTLWPDIDQAFADVAKQVRRAVEEQTDSAPKAQLYVPRTADAPRQGVAAPAQLPRSSNLRLKKEFTEQDRDEFLRNGLDYIARFFEGSLQAVEERNPGVKGIFDRIDSRRFS